MRWTERPITDGVDGMANLRPQAAPRLVVGRTGPHETAPIGHQADGHAWSGSEVLEGRATKISARSAKPAHRFTSPSPLTAPRTKLLVSNARSGAQAGAT